MVKFRKLTLEELENLEAEFVRFLATQSITGEDWIAIQKNSKERQEALISQFSDVVFEKTLHNVQILEQRTEKRLLFFNFLEDKVELLGVEFQGDAEFDLRQSFKLKDFSTWIEDPEKNAGFIKGSKPYDKEKLKEIFEVLEEGSRIVEDRSFFDTFRKYFD